MVVTATASVISSSGGSGWEGLCRAAAVDIAVIVGIIIIVIIALTAS